MYDVLIVDCVSCAHIRERERERDRVMDRERGKSTRRTARQIPGKSYTETVAASAALVLVHWCFAATEAKKEGMDGWDIQEEREPPSPE